VTILATGNAVAKIDLMSSLGQHIELSGVIEFGSRQAQLIGFPTANIRILTTAVIPDGVYASLASVRFDDGCKTYPSISYISNKLRSDLPEICFYTHLFGFFGDIYGRRVTFKALYLIRAGEVAITSKVAQLGILDDIAIARSCFTSRDGMCAP
jgi:FAD synthase